jgi:hypothetical protein
MDETWQEAVNGRRGGEEAEAELGARARGSLGLRLVWRLRFSSWLSVGGSGRCEWGLIQDGKSNLFPVPVSLRARKLSTYRNFGAPSKRV